MSGTFPGFVYSVASCPDDPSVGRDCCSQANLEKIAERVHRARPSGTTSLAKDLLQAWEMKDFAQVATAATMGKQIEIYTPPCGRMIEVALGLSCEIATINNSMFQHVIDQKAEPSTIPCKIYVDDRLGSASTCSSHTGFARMNLLKKILKECAGGKPFGFNLWPAPPGVTSGTWLAYHFNIPYLDRRCYRMDGPEQGHTVKPPPSVVEILKEGSESGGDATTGKFFILDNSAVTASVEWISFPDSKSVTQPIRDWQIFQLKSEPNQLNMYIATYFREHELSLQAMPHQIPENFQREKEGKDQNAADLHEKDREVQNAPDLSELKASAKQLLKVGWKLGKSKVNKLMDGNR